MGECLFVLLHCVVLHCSVETQVEIAFGALEELGSSKNVQHRQVILAGVQALCLLNPADFG
jgi:hypothetical protein